MKQIQHTLVIAILLSLFHNSLTAVNTPYKAVVVVPVVDLVGKPLSQEKQPYHLPISGVEKHGSARIHQLIFNEIVTVLEEHDNEVRISIPTVFFERAESARRYTEYWVQKDALIPLNTCKEKNIPLTIFPDPVSFESYETELPDTKKNSTIITLTFPHYDAVTNYTYSAGTRFVQTNAQHKKTISVYAYSQKHNRALILSLPKKNCLLQKSRTPHEKITLFTNLVQQWAQLHQGFIPYVLGGCSFTQSCKDNNFIKKGNAYYRPGYPHNPAAGLDCTGLIVRAAQLCGIPYFFKNTTTLAKHLRPLAPNEQPENGDIIWINGHAIIITDITTNMCVEARSYDHGFGKIHRLPIDKLFAGIKNLDELKTAMFTKKAVIRLDSAGKEVQKMPTIKILKLASVWEKKSPHTL